MTDHRVEPGACYEIFNKVEAKARNAARIHTSLSGDIDALGTLCAGESSILASKLNGLYNRVLTWAPGRKSCRAVAHRIGRYASEAS